jgi:DNA-directed RNA polymerase subunit beta
MKREERAEQREILGAIIAEDVTLEGEAPRQTHRSPRPRRPRPNASAPPPPPRREGDELTDEVLNRLVRQGIDTVKVFASYTQIDLRDELDAIDRGSATMRAHSRVMWSTPETGEKSPRRASRSTTP